MAQEQTPLTREHLEATKPKREQFKTEEAFEEALGRWFQHQGRILAATNPSGDSPRK